MTPAPAPAAPQVTSGPVASYADQLSAFEARRRATDDILLRKMVNSRDATPFGKQVFVPPGEAISHHPGKPSP